MSVTGFHRYEIAQWWYKCRNTSASLVVLYVQIAQSRVFPASRNKPRGLTCQNFKQNGCLHALLWHTSTLYTDYLNVRHSFVILVLQCNYYPYWTYLYLYDLKFVKWYLKIAVYMHLVIPVTITTAMAADVMRKRCFSSTERPEETDWYVPELVSENNDFHGRYSLPYSFNIYLSRIINLVTGLSIPSRI